MKAGKIAVSPSRHGMHPAAYAASCSSMRPLLPRRRLLERRVLPVARLRERLLELPLLRRERLLVDRRLVPALRGATAGTFGPAAIGLSGCYELQGPIVISTAWAGMEPSRLSGAPC